MIETPFLCVLAVDSDLSLTALEHVLGIWFDNYGTIPSVLWCNPRCLAYSDRILEMLTDKYRYIVAIPDPTYVEDSWSLGTRRDKGMGSVGA